MSSPVAAPAGSPRVRSVPLAATSAGQDAVDLAEAAGLHLDPWQAQALVDGLGERPDGKWASFEVGLIVPRQNGKGAVLEARELAGLFLFDEALILHTAHELKTSLEAFRRILTLIDGCDDLRRRVRRVLNTNGAESIELKSGARLRFLARSKGSGRGFSGDCMIFDEAYELTSSQVEALMPTLSARPNPQVWYTSSPPLDAVSGEQLLSVRDRGVAGGSSLTWLDWGVAPGADLDDQAVWAAANPALGHRISTDFIQRERAAMSDIGFARERLGVWPRSAADGWAVIPENDWRALADLDSAADGTVAFAIDLTPDRSQSAIGVAGRRADGLGHVEIVDHRPGTGWVVDRAKTLVARWRPAAVVIDAAGPAGSLIADLEAAGIEVVKPSAREAAQAAGAFWDAVSGRDEDGEPRQALRHRDDPELATALAGAVKRPLGDAWAWSRRDTTVDISPLVAVTLASWAFAKFGQDDYEPLDNIW